MIIEEVKRAVILAIHKQMNWRTPCIELTDTIPLENLGVDSLKAIQILYELEDKFEIEILNDEVLNARTVDDITKIVWEMLKNNQAESIT